jgi:predicted helicase
MTKKAEIYYVTLTDEMLREDKLAWFKNTRFAKLPFEKINPDDKGNWLNLTDNDFESLLPLVDKEVKAGKGEQAIFKLFSSGIKTQRDDWVYDFDKNNLESKMLFFVDIYKSTLKNADFKEKHFIKWDADLDSYANRTIEKEFEENNIVESIYRPFTKQFLYFDKHFNGRTYQWFNIFNRNYSNIFMAISSIGFNKEFQVLASNDIVCLDCLEKTQCLPLYVYDKEGNPHDNITDWALNQFQNHYENLRGFKNLAGLTKANTFQQSEFKPWFEIQKLDIFDYVYAVLHNPAYREKYQQNLKREFPRIPFYDDFEQWVEWGKQLMDLHLYYETVEPYPLKRQDLTLAKIPKTKLKADKEQGLIFIDDNTILSEIPASAWDYKLGNRSALEWVLDQYKEKKPKDPTIAEKFNNYRFADYKEQVIELLMRVCAVSVATVKIVQAMKQ